jgi:lactate dehydrogenase-like 2-hydroxyacid dehydrogenase
MSNQALPKLLVTRKLPMKVEARISHSYNATTNPDDTLWGRNELVEKSIDCDAILICPTDKCTLDLITALPDCIKMIATFSVGFDHIDISAAQSRGLVITNTPDVLTDATADISMLLLLGAARGAGWGEQMVRNNAWRAWCPTGPLGVDVTGRRLGIFGMGRIGRALARRARGFDMEIHYHNRKQFAPDIEQGATYHANLDDLMGVSDFLSINCASTPETRNAINRQRLALLPNGAVVVNSARGDIVDDDAMITALKSGRLAAGGFDVFRGEPDIDPRYCDLQNVFLLPHLGSATNDTRTAMGMRALDNLDAYFAGNEPKDRIV